MSDEETIAEEEEVTGPPQAPGDPGYEPPAIIPELDFEGGTIYKVGEDEYATLEEAEAAIAPPEAEVTEEDE